MVVLVGGCSAVEPRSSRFADVRPRRRGTPDDDTATEQFTSYASHNPTLTLTSRSSPGIPADCRPSTLRTRYAPPGSACTHRPRWLRWRTRIPRSASGPNKVVMWSYRSFATGSCT